MGSLMARRREHAIVTLQAEFAGTLSPETVARFVIETFDELTAVATVPNYLPLWVSDIAHRVLALLAELVPDLQPRPLSLP